MAIRIKDEIWWSGVGEYEIDVPYVGEVMSVDPILEKDLLNESEYDWYCMREQSWAIREGLTQ